MNERDRDNLQSNVIQTFLQIVDKHVPKKTKERWSMEIELCKPAGAGDIPERLRDKEEDFDEEDDNVIARMELHPKSRNAYEVVYIPEDRSQPGWTLTLDRNGQISNLEGISTEGFTTGLDILIDHEFPKPQFRHAIIEVSEDQGDSELPEGHGYFGTLINKNIYVGGIIIHYSPPTS